jgi:glycosyltransferase involved in cell wall biosynthesis
MPGVEPSRSWDDLKSLLSRHRFFVHTASPQLEDGYNMATLEAMATGLPLLGNAHPSSLIEHGTNGFVSNDPEQLAGYARKLLETPELARSLGRAAKETARSRFSMAGFARQFAQSIETAIAKWKAHQKGSQGNIRR